MPGHRSLISKAFQTFTGLNRYNLKLSINPDEKIRLKSDFDYVKENGRKYVSRVCIMVKAPSPDGNLHFGVICGKKFSNKAVLRNRARRLIWESLRLIKHQIRPVTLIVIVRRDMADKRRQDVQEELTKLLKNAELLTD